jgi:D-inositol-3-phosphate glycosyltransferase
MTLPRIAMISYHTCPLASQEGKETGGMNVYVLELSKELARSGHQVDIFTRCQDENNPLIVEVEENLRVIHLSAGPFSISKKEMFQYIQEFVGNFDRFVQEHKLSYDVLHCHYYLSGLIGLEIQKKFSKKIPLIMTFHTLALMKNLVARDELEHEEKERIDAEFLLTQKADKIIAPSETDMNYLQYLYQAQTDKTVVIPPGVDTELFRPLDKMEAKKFIGAEADHKIVLFAGRIEPLKGIDGLIYAMKILTQKHSDCEICLWIVGGDISQHPSLWSKELKKLEKLRRTLRITTSVKFVGQRPQSELPYYYNAAEVVVMPSHYESFGMAAAEAMACGVPVITTNVAGVTSFLDEKHRALVTSVNNPLLLASQIEQTLIEPELHKKISQEVVQKIQDLKWSNIAQKVSQVYQELTQSTHD